MSDSTQYVFMGFFFGIAASILIGGAILSAILTHHRREAVQRGFAEWQCDDVGNAKFIWKESK